MVKESIYNYSTSITLGDKVKQLVYNTRSRRLINFTNRSFQEISSQEERILIEQGFLVSDTRDECVEMEYDRLCRIFQKEMLSLTIIPTSDCNFRCVYCYQTASDGYITSSVINNIISYLEKNARYYKAVSISWFGGEPLLCKNEVLEILQQAALICKKNKVSLVSYMTTNAYELDLVFFEKALSYGLRYYQITIDGLAEEHNSQRPHCTNNDSYEKIIKNLTEIAKQFQTKRFEIGLRVNVSSNNIGSMERFTDEMVRLFGHDRHFVMIWQWVRDWGGNRLDKKSLISNDACRKLMDDSIKKGLRCHEILSCQAGTDTCEAMYKSGLVFNFDGNVYKCAMRVFNADEHKKNCVGKLLENGNIVFDKGIEAQWLLPTVRQSCYSCVFFPLCMGNACPFTMVYRNEHTCIVFKNLIPDQMKTMYLKGNYTNFEVIESAQDRKKTYGDI